MTPAHIADGPGNIVWLASYPKSGNTWMRVVLGHLLGLANLDGDINDQSSHDGIASSREDFDDIVGVDASELNTEQIDSLRPQVFECLSQETRRVLFIKAHDAYLPTPAGEPLFPLNATRGVIHIVRNPLDVTASWAHHHGMTLAKAVESLCDTRFAYCTEPNSLHSQLRQRLLDWSGHAASWLDSPLPRLTVRYEDMLLDPAGTFAAVAHYCGLNKSPQEITQAVNASRFDRLQQLESQTRFKETPRGRANFFREGKAGGWRNVLSPEQVERIVSAHGSMMQRLGYEPRGT